MAATGIAAAAGRIAENAAVFGVAGTMMQPSASETLRTGEIAVFYYKGHKRFTTVCDFIESHDGDGSNYVFTESFARIACRTPYSLEIVFGLKRQLGASVDATKTYYYAVPPTATSADVPSYKDFVPYKKIVLNDGFVVLAWYSERWLKVSCGYGFFPLGVDLLKGNFSGILGEGVQTALRGLSPWQAQIYLEEALARALDGHVQPRLFEPQVFRTALCFGELRTESCLVTSSSSVRFSSLNTAVQAIVRQWNNATGRSFAQGRRGAGGILFGPYGAGKSRAAEIAALEVGARIYQFSYSEQRSWAGLASRIASEATPCLCVFDELHDANFGIEEHQIPTNEFLLILDKILANELVVAIAILRERDSLRALHPALPRRFSHFAVEIQPLTREDIRKCFETWWNVFVDARTGSERVREQRERDEWRASFPALQAAEAENIYTMASRAEVIRFKYDSDDAEGARWVWQWGAIATTPWRDMWTAVDTLSGPKVARTIPASRRIEGLQRDNPHPRQAFPTNFAEGQPVEGLALFDVQGASWLGSFFKSDIKYLFKYEDGRWKWRAHYLPLTANVDAARWIPTSESAYCEIVSVSIADEAVRRVLQKLAREPAPAPPTAAQDLESVADVHDHIRDAFPMELNVTIHELQAWVSSYWTEHQMAAQREEAAESPAAEYRRLFGGENDPLWVADLREYLASVRRQQSAA